MLYCSEEELSETVRASEFAISGISVTSLLLTWRWGILVPVDLPDILRIIDQTFFYWSSTVDFGYIDAPRLALCSLMVRLALARMIIGL